MSEKDDALLQEKWVKVQKKTFTNWANNILKQRGMKIEDLQFDLADGVLLINLVELISLHQFKVYNRKPRILQHRLENLTFALKFLTDEGLKLVNIGAPDISAGNLRLILGLIWTIILRYQIQKGREEASKNALLDWVNSKIGPARHVDNFTDSWADGMSLCALCNALKPDIVPMEGRDASTGLQNCTDGEDGAERELEIPKVFQPEDMVAASDALSCMTYISYFRDYDEKMRKAMSAEEARLAAERLERTPDPSKCSFDGPGIKGGEVNIPADFTVTLRNAAGRPIPQDVPDERVRVPVTIDVDIKEPSGTPVQEIALTDNHNSTHGVRYIPRQDGKHPISVLVNGVAIKPSPVVVPILPPTPDPSKCTATGPGVTGAQAGDPLPFTVQARNRIGDPISVGGHPFKADVKGPFGEPVPVTLVDNKDGTYSGSYDPAPGDHVVAITCKGVPIAGSPYVCPVTADAKLAYAGTSYAYGPGIEGPVNTFDPAVFYIQAVNPAGEKLAHGGDIFSVDVEDQNGFELGKVNIADNKDGTYTVQYQACEPGVHMVHVKLHHPRQPLYYTPIKASPHRVAIEPGLDPSKSLCFGPGLSDEVYDNKPTEFTVQTRDCLGRDMKQGGLPIDVTVQGPDGPVPVEVLDNKDGTYTVKYEPTAKGDTDVKVACKGQDLAQSPYHLHVKAGADFNHTTIGEFSFVVVSRDKKGELHRKGGERLEVAVKMPSGKMVEGVKVQDAGDGTYVASYSLPPEATGAYEVGVTLNGHPIRGSPFTQALP